MYRKVSETDCIISYNSNRVFTQISLYKLKYILIYIIILHELNVLYMILLLKLGLILLTHSY